LRREATEYGVLKSDVEGFLDVRFAAMKTQETGKLVFLPFLVQFMMLIARNSYFDNWTWPPFLIVIFIGNVVLSVTAWIVLRRSASILRRDALNKLGRKLRQTEMLMLLRPAKKTRMDVRKAGLQEIKRLIEEERQGAYSRWVQDPAFLAVLVPTGMLGILNVLFQALFGFM
jgi:hypothetical protein